jgi:hypothetical protein
MERAKVAGGYVEDGEQMNASRDVEVNSEAVVREEIGPRDPEGTRYLSHLQISDLRLLRPRYCYKRTLVNLVSLANFNKIIEDVVYIHVWLQL